LRRRARRERERRERERERERERVVDRWAARTRPQNSPTNLEFSPSARSLSQHA
jgi:hypothetical protein